MKINKKSVSILGLVAFLFLGMSGLQAQPKKREFKRGGDQSIGLSAEQKEQMKEARIAFAKATIDLKNEMGELKAKQRTLFSAEKPNMNQIYANADKISDVKNQLMKEKISMKLDTRSFLTEEQCVKMGQHAKHKKGLRHGKKGQMGQANRAEQGGKQRGMRNGERMAQQGKKGNGMKQKAGKQMKQGRNLLDLSDEQKEQMKELRIAHLKDTKGLKNELEVIRLNQKHLMTAENVDKKAVMANVDQLSGVQNKLTKKGIDHKMEVREILTEDQLVLFISHPKGKKGFGKRHKRMN